MFLLTPSVRRLQRSPLPATTATVRKDLLFLHQSFFITSRNIMPTGARMEEAEEEKYVESGKQQQQQQQIATMASSLVSQTLIVLFLILPHLSLSPSPPATDAASSCSFPPLVAFLQQLLSASSSSQVSSKKRKDRDVQEDEEDEEEGEEGGVDGACDAVVSRAQADHFRLSFRMSAATFEWLACLLDPLLDCRRGPPGCSAIQVPARLAIGLARLASGEPYLDLARRFGVPVPVARFCAGRLRRVLCTNFRFWLAFPASSDLPAVSAGFQALAGEDGLPDCCGAVACVRFPQDGESALATQIVADSSLRILNIAGGFRGDETDYDVLKRSSLYKDVVAGRLLGENQYLVGGSGYPLLPWLMVPFTGQVGGDDDRSSEDFNAVHRSTQRPACRVVASLRNWGVLNNLIEEEDAKAAVACIGTCAILHNVLLMREDYSAISDAGEDERRHESVEYSAADAKAVQLRRALTKRITAVQKDGH